MKLHWHVVAAVFKRNFVGYFINPIGYLFIAAFVLGFGYFAVVHNDAFFASNIADLQQLNEVYPFLLLFFIPAITMTMWAEERKTGTEELLLTLPGSDIAIVLGKYLSGLAIYTVALIYSIICYIIFLKTLGNPDLGLMFSNFVGYWLAGAALLAAGLLASSFTGNVTVAFIWGVAVCLPFVLLDRLATFATGFTRDVLEQASIVMQFQPFSNGLIPLSSVVYFLSIVVVMLYLNMVMLGRRHWAGSDAAPERWVHHLTRAASLIVATVCFTILVDRAEGYATFLEADVTAEKLHTLSADTVKIVKEVDRKQPVYIEAFISPRVPTQYVETRRNLIDLLRRFDTMGGNAIEVNIHDTELYSQEATKAEEVYQIRPVAVPTEEGGRFGQEEIFLGVAFASGLNEKSIPFFYHGLPVEYELARTIRTVSQRAQRKVGILTTDAQLFGSFNFQTMQPGQDWMIVDELKQQYDVVQVSPDSEIVETLDALIVPMASSLTQTQLNNLIDYVKKGNPTLVLDDPMPFINPQLAAREPKQNNQNPMMMGRQPPPTPKGNVQDLMRVLNIDFDTGHVVWQAYNPHPQFKDLPPEYVFISPEEGQGGLNAEHAITSGLQEVVAIYPGSVRPKGGDGPSFTPLLTTAGVSGRTEWDSIFASTFLGRALNPVPTRTQSSTDFVIACLVEGELAESTKSESAKEEKGEEKVDAAKPIKAIFVGDLDMVSDAFFDLRRRGSEDLQFDNVTFILNCVDTLVGDEAFVELRKKRPQRRTLERIRELTKSAALDKAKRTEKAEKEADEALDKAQQRLDEAVKKIRERTDLDRRSKDQLIEAARQKEQAKLDKEKTEIEQQKRSEIKQAEIAFQQANRQIERRFKFGVLLPLVPVLGVGMVVFFARIAGEKEGVDPSRLV